MTSGHEPFSADWTMGVMAIRLNINRVIQLPLVVMSEVCEEPGWQT